MKNTLCPYCGKPISKSICSYCSFDIRKSDIISFVPVALTTGERIGTNKDKAVSKSYRIASEPNYDAGETDVALAIIDWFGDQTDNPDEAARRDFYNAISFLDKKAESTWPMYKVNQMIDGYIDMIREVSATTDESPKKTAGYTKAVSFFMPIEDVFVITGRGTVVVGIVLLGTIKAGDKVEIILSSGERLMTTATSIEMFHKVLDFAEKGDAVGVFLRGLKKADIIGAQGLVNPGADIIHKRIKGSLHLKRKNEGGNGRPMFNYYKPYLRNNGKDVRGIITIDRNELHSQLTLTGENPPNDVVLLPGNTATVHVEFDAPIAVIPGMRFDIHEGDSEIIGILSVESTED